MTEPMPTAQRELRAADLAAVRDQLGREPTTPFTVVARCTGGHPLVIRNVPIDAAGDPFPTTYWLTCPDAVKAISRVESEGWIARLNERMTDDDGVPRLRRGGPRRVRGRPGDRPRRRRRVGWRGRHAHRHQVPARPLRLPARRGRRPGGGVGRRARRAGARRSTARPGRGDRSGHELDPAARGGAGRRTGRARDRARARHADHQARPGCRPHRPLRPRRARPHRRGAGLVLSPRPGSRGRAHPGGRDERRAGCGEPRRVRVGGPQARRLRARGDHRRAGSGPLVPRRHPWARPLVGAVRGPGHRWRLDGVR